MQYKICTNVPKTHIEQVRLAIGKAWAGKIGNYIYCSFVMSWTGYFLPTEWANPAIGTVWIPESVQEYRLEVVCEDIYMKQVLLALRESHPYEEPPIDIYKLEDTSQFE